MRQVEVYAMKSDTGNAFYNVKNGFDRIVKSSYAPIDFRLQTLFNKLNQVPAYYQAAKVRLTHTNPAEIDLVVAQQTETFIFFEKTLPDFVAQNHQLTPQYVERLSDAKLAVRDYIAYVESFKLQ